MPDPQTIAALGIVAVTAAIFTWRIVKRRKEAAKNCCGRRCGCPTSRRNKKLKAKQKPQS